MFKVVSNTKSQSHLSPSYVHLSFLPNKNSSIARFCCKSRFCWMGQLLRILVKMTLKRSYLGDGIWIFFIHGKAAAFSLLLPLPTKIENFIQIQIWFWFNKKGNIFRIKESHSMHFFCTLKPHKKLVHISLYNLTKSHFCHWFNNSKKWPNIRNKWTFAIIHSWKNLVRK